MSESLVSVILPMWKTKSSLVSQSLQSILEQTFTNLELLVIYEKSYYSKSLNEEEN